MSSLVPAAAAGPHGWRQLALLAAAALGLGAYVAFGPNHAKRRKQRSLRKRRLNGGEPPGLTNFGTTCFVNAVVQALAASDEFYDWVCSGQEEEHSVHQALREALEYLNNESEKEVEGQKSAVNLLRSLRMHGWTIDPDQQDAYELLHVLFTSLEEETNKVDPIQSPTGDLSLVDDGDPVTESEGFFSRVSESGIGLKRTPSEVRMRRRRSMTPFSGTLASKVTTDCSHNPVNSVDFSNVTLHLPQNISVGLSVDLSLLLHMYVAQESVDDQTSKQVTFGRLPRCLCFHIQRTSFAGGIVGKRNDPVTFPLKLDMSGYLYSNQLLKSSLMKDRGGEKSKALNRSPVWFDLRAVVIHIGSHNSGHYVTYRRGSSNKENAWFLISDDEVTRVSSSKVLGSQQAYMLFYDKSAVERKLQSEFRLD